MKVDGGCHCGKIAYEAEIDPEKVAICHCTDCQTGSGSAYRTNVPSMKNSFRLLSGEPRIYMKTAESGNRRAQGFCADCGTPLTYEWEGADVEVAIGAFDDPAAIKPVMQIQTQDKLPWFGELDGLPGRPGGETAKADALFAKIVSYQHPDHDTESWPHG